MPDRRRRKSFQDPSAGHKRAYGRDDPGHPTSDEDLQEYIRDFAVRAHARMPDIPMAQYIEAANAVYQGRLHGVAGVAPGTPGGIDDPRLSLHGLREDVTGAYATTNALYEAANLAMDPGGVAAPGTLGNRLIGGLGHFATSDEVMTHLRAGGGVQKEAITPQQLRDVGLHRMAGMSEEWDVREANERAKIPGFLEGELRSHRPFGLGGAAGARINPAIPGDVAPVVDRSLNEIPRSTRELGALEGILNTLTKSLTTEEGSSNSLNSLLKIASGSGGGGMGVGGGGGGTGGGSGETPGGSFFRAANQTAVGALVEELPMIGGPLRMALQVGQLVNSYADTRAQAYSQTMQLEQGWGMAGERQKDLHGEDGSTFGYKRMPLIHTMGTMDTENLRYQLGNIGIVGGMGAQAGIQTGIAMQSMGVGGQAKTANEASLEVQQATALALGPGRAMGLNPQEAIEAIGTAMGKGGQTAEQVAESFQKMNVASREVNIGTKQLTESYKDMVSMGISNINVEGMAAAQKMLGPGASVGGFMGTVGAMTGTDTYAAMMMLGMGPKSNSLKDQKAALEGFQDPSNVIEHLATRTQQMGGVGNFFTWQKLVETAFGGTDPFKAAGVTPTHEMDIWNQMRTGATGPQLEQWKKLVQTGETKPGAMEDPNTFLKSSLDQAGQSVTTFSQVLQKAGLEINHLFAEGVLQPGGAAKVVGGPAAQYPGTMPHPTRLRPPGHHTPAPSYLGGIPEPEPLAASLLPPQGALGAHVPAPSYRGGTEESAIGYLAGAPMGVRGAPDWWSTGQRVSDTAGGGSLGLPPHLMAALGSASGRANWGAIAPQGPYGDAISGAIAGGLGVPAGALSGPGGLTGQPGHVGLTPDMAAALTSALAQAFASPSVSGSLRRAVDQPDTHTGGPERSATQGLVDATLGSHQGREAALAFTNALMQALVPALAQDVGQAFATPAVRTAMAQALSMALQAAQSGLSTSQSTSTTGSTGTTDTGGPGTANVLQGTDGTPFRSFTGVPTKDGKPKDVSVFSGSSSQGSATIHPDLFKVYEDVANATGVPLSLLLTNTAHESMFDPTAVAPDGGYGLAQFTAPKGDARVPNKYLDIKPGEDWTRVARSEEWSKDKGWQVTKAGEQRVAAGQANYLRDLYDQSGGDWQLALDKYRAGPGATKSAGDYGSQILSAAETLDLSLSGTLTVTDLSGKTIGEAKIKPTHATVNGRKRRGGR